MEADENFATPMGGTELMLGRLHASLPRDFLENFQIIPSKVREELRPDKIRVFWAHDLAGDPAADGALGGERWKRFHKIVFVSHWQQWEYVKRYHIPWSRCAVMQNSIEPIKRKLPWSLASGRVIEFIYHTTPHRGLSILVPVFEQLAERYRNIRLSVYSSFKLYAQEKEDAPFAPLFDRIRSHPSMVYRGAVSNEAVRAALALSHVFAYPSIWLETSCLSLIEAMSAGLVCIHPCYGALPETAANWTSMYPMDEDLLKHASLLYAMLDACIVEIRRGAPTLRTQVAHQKSYADKFYNWQTRTRQWRALLGSLLGLPRDLPKEPSRWKFPG